MTQKKAGEEEKEEEEERKRPGQSVILSMLGKKYSYVAPVPPPTFRPRPFTRKNN